jgi:mannose-6-phosphate isomerase-like protein (cupin superfamily)
VIVNRANADHYSWGEGCDGWVLMPGPDLLVIEERMPPGTSERPHRHLKARQLFRVLSGELTMIVAGGRHVLGAGDCIGIGPGVVHQARNDSAGAISFLVISSPTVRGDREDVELDA